VYVKRNTESSILTSGNHGRDCETAPFVSTSRQSEQSHEERQAPELANEAVESAFGEVIAAVRQRQHQDDLQHRRRNRQHVGVESRKADTLQSQGKVALHRRSRNVCHQADEVQSPHRLVTPGAEDVAECSRLLQGRNTLGGIVAQNSVDHDCLFVLSVPRAAPKNVLGACWRNGEVEPADEADGESQKTLKLQSCQWASFSTQMVYSPKTARTIQVGLQYLSSGGYRQQAMMR